MGEWRGEEGKEDVQARCCAWWCVLVSSGAAKKCKRTKSLDMTQLQLIMGCSLSEHRHLDTVIFLTNALENLNESLERDCLGRS